MRKKRYIRVVEGFLFFDFDLKISLFIGFGVFWYFKDLGFLVFILNQEFGYFKLGYLEVEVELYFLQEGF